MFNLFSQRVLTVLQLTRMALVFTAISDSLCALMLWGRSHSLPGESLSHFLDVPRVGAVAAMSLGLYGFGMSLNDINDRRRDLQTASDRPIPSGRIGVASAHVVCALFGICAVVAGAFVAQFDGEPGASLLLLAWTLLLILFYDFVGKYLVMPGLLTLGMVRFFHATIAAPRLPLLWQPLLLLNHVTIISMIAYRWESKRPALTLRQQLGIVGGLLGADALCIGLVAWRRIDRPGGLLDALSIDARLCLPLAAVVGFVALAISIHRVAGDTRRAGQMLTLYGLLWLIVYDAAIAAAFASPIGGAMLLLLLPLAYLSLQSVRWWTKIISLSHRPEFQRIR